MSISPTAPWLTMRDGYVAVMVNFWCGSHQYIGHIFTAQGICGLLVNMKPAWTFLLSCMDSVGLLVLTPRLNCTAIATVVLLGTLDCNVVRCWIKPIHDSETAWAGHGWTVCSSDWNSCRQVHHYQISSGVNTQLAQCYIMVGMFIQHGLSCHQDTEWKRVKVSKY